MTKPQHQDGLYEFLQSRVRNTLDLQYAIRASETLSPTQMGSLNGLQSDVRLFWKELGASDEEIDHEALVDFAFDTLQVGFPLARRHDRLFHPEMLEIISRGLASVRGEFAASLPLFEIPAARFFRVCDLLSGGAISIAIDQVMSGRKTARNYGPADEVDAEHFTLRLREPIFLHPAFRYGTRDEDGRTVFGFEIDLGAEIDLLDWERQIDEFQYQYASYRAAFRKGRPDPTARELINGYLKRQHRGKHSGFEVTRVDSLIGVLAGLLCWDLYKKGGLKRHEAITQVASAVSRGEDNVKKNYDDATKRIALFVAKFSVKTSGTGADAAAGQTT